MRTVRRRAATLVASTLVAVSSLATTPAHAASFPEPDQDPFYAPPAGFEQKAPGTVLRSRQITLTGLGIPLPVATTQLLIRTTDATGHPVTTASTVLVPPRPFWSRFRPRHLIAYQPPTDSLGDQCEPSYKLRTGDFTSDLALVAPLLLNGDVVVITDHQGPRHAYSAGPMAGHATLDGVRATESLSGLELAGARTPVGMWGYSGGAIATGWAAELHPTYAPELNVKGAAVGGTPADLVAVARNLDGGPFSGIMLLATLGLMREYPIIKAAFNDAGRALDADLADACTDAAVRYPFRSISEFVTVDDPLHNPLVLAFMNAVKLGNTAPRAPMYVYHAFFDEGIPFAQAQQLVDDWRAKGVDVTFSVDYLSEHAILGATGAPGAIAYLTDRLNR